MILTHESDTGTVIRVPRLADDDPAKVEVDTIDNGYNVTTDRIPVSEWPGYEADLLRIGYVPLNEPPERVAVLDVERCRFHLAGVDHELDNPADGTGEDPIEPLVVQADDVISDSHFTRMTNWWRRGDELHAAVIPSPPSDVPIECRYTLRSQLQVAAGYLRDWLAQGEQTEERIADRLRLTVDPTSRGHADRVGRLLDHDYDSKFIDALVAYHIAVLEAVKGDSRTCAYWCGAVPSRLH